MIYLLICCLAFLVMLYILNRAAILGNQNTEIYKNDLKNKNGN